MTTSRKLYSSPIQLRQEIMDLLLYLIEMFYKELVILFLFATFSTQSKLIMLENIQLATLVQIFLRSIMFLSMRDLFLRVVFRLNRLDCYYLDLVSGIFRREDIPISHYLDQNSTLEFHLTTIQLHPYLRLDRLEI